MARINKDLMYHGLINFIFVMVAVRQSDVDMFTMPNQSISFYESSDGGPVLVAPTTIPSTMSGHSWKSSSRFHEPMMDEYDRIMQDVRSQSPVVHGPSQQHDQEDNAVTTMVLGMSEPSSALSHGGLQFSRYPTDGAVGGFAQSFMTDENLDIFNNFTPENMREDEINELISNEGVSSLDQSFPDINWQQFISDYDQFVHGASGITKSIDSVTNDWSTTDLLSEAIQTSELFLPFPTSSQNSSEFGPSATLDTDNAVTEARLELMEFNEWASQDHQEDMLFPSLPPPSYEQVTQSQRLNVTIPEIPQPARFSNHLHDHNYYNTSSPPNVEENTSAQSTSYAIRSRREVSTRVISIPPRPRHISSGAESSSSSTIDEVADSNEASSDGRLPSLRDIESPNRLTEVTEQSSAFNSFVIKPVNLTYFDNISKTVGARREVILCN